MDTVGADAAGGQVLDLAERYAALDGQFRFAIGMLAAVCGETVVCNGARAYQVDHHHLINNLQARTGVFGAHVAQATTYARATDRGSATGYSAAVPA